MFVYACRASTLKFFGVIALSLTALIILIAVIPTYNTATTLGGRMDDNIRTNVGQSQDVSMPAAAHDKITYTKIKTNEDRIAFLLQFGWQVNPEPYETEEISFPAEFDQVISAYNELQKEQGLDLSKYRRKTVTRYTYEVTNYPNCKDTVYATVLIYRNRVIGGDLCSANRDGGFVHGFALPEQS